MTTSVSEHPSADGLCARALTGLASASTLPTAATVGVVVTTYNHAHFLEQALQSVRSQTRATDAVMVVDDGSTDDPAG